MNRRLTVAALFGVAAVSLLLAHTGLPFAIAAPTTQNTAIKITGDATSGIVAVTTSTGYQRAVRGLVLAADAAGVVTFNDGTAGGTELFRVYLEANETLLIPPSALGKGFLSTSGQGIFASHDNSGTIHGTLVINDYASTFATLDSVATATGGAATFEVLAAPTDGTAHKVRGFVVAATAAGNVTFTDGSGGTELARVYVDQNKTIVVGQDLLGGGFSCSADTALHAVHDNSGTVHLSVRYTTE